MTKRVLVGLILLPFFFLILPNQSSGARSSPEISNDNFSVYLPIIQQNSILDPMTAGIIEKVNPERIYQRTENLVAKYSPRHPEFSQVYANAECALGVEIYPQNNLLRALGDVKSQFEDFGYSVITEPVPEKYGGGYNIVARNPAVGFSHKQSTIDIGAHLDAWKSWDTGISTPGASDNAVAVAGLLEMASLLVDYPNQHPWQFVVFVSEERGRHGSEIHAEAMAEQPFKAGLILDGIGWSETSPNPMNCTWAFEDLPGSLEVAAIFNQVRQQYQISINWRLCSDKLQTSDHVSYYEKGLPAVLSVGGLPYGGEYYHKCQDNLQNLDLNNAVLTIQENVGVLLTLDREP
jgi:hypothetical protein